MKTKRFSVEQIAAVLKEAEAGMPVARPANGAAAIHERVGNGADAVWLSQNRALGRSITQTLIFELAIKNDSRLRWTYVAVNTGPAIGAGPG